MLLSPHVPTDMTLDEILEHTTTEYDECPLQIHGRTVELGLIRKLHAILKQAETSRGAAA